MKTREFAITLFILATAIAGCSRSPHTTFYKLTPVEAEVTTADRATSPTVAIASVTLPEMVDRPQLVLPDSGVKVQLLETHRWAEPLKTAIPRILADNLSRRIGSDKVSFHPQYASGKANYRIFVDLQQFEATQGAVVLDALWTIKAAEGGPAVTRRSRQVVQIAGTGYEAMVAAYSKTLGLFAEEMAAVVILLPKVQAPAGGASSKTSG